MAMNFIDMLMATPPLPLGDPRRRKHYGVNNLPNINLAAEQVRLQKLVKLYKPAFPPDTDVPTAWIAGHLDISAAAVCKSLKVLTKAGYVVEVFKKERTEGCITGKFPKYWRWVR